MPNTDAPPAVPVLSAFISSELEVGDPDVAGNLAVFPVFGPEPELEYLSLAEATKLGFSVGELDSGPSVNDLTVVNPTGKPVLLFEGEEVLGAQQNRTFDVPVLVGAGNKASVPVSCMERGRWDGARSQEHFDVSPQAAGPRLRRLKSIRAAERAAAGLDARADQSEVWKEISSASARLGAHSPTEAMHDVFETRRRELAEAAHRIPLHDGQVGAIAAIGGELRVLDYASRADAFASLHARLVQGYALDGLDSEAGGKPPSTGTARGFALLACDAPLAQRGHGIGLGEEVRFAANGVAGAGLVHEDELVCLSVHPAS